MKRLWEKITHHPSKDKKTIVQSQPKQNITQQSQQQWTEAEAQIINQLINMNTLIKLIKNVNDSEYKMLLNINQILCSETIQIKQLKDFLASGKLIYQYYPIRALVWKVLIGYLPSEEKKKWISFLEGSLIKYQKMISQFIITTAARKMGILKKNNKTTEVNKDHPLNSENSSKWKNYFEDIKLWNLIEKDTIRTRLQCNFFQEEHLYQLQSNITNQAVPFLPQNLHLSNLVRKSTYYYDSLTRILFIYCKKHPQVGYWQGMNEIAAIIYYSYTNKNSQYFRRVSQSDTYFTFEYIMNRLGNKHFGSGQQYSKRLNETLQKIDHKLYNFLESKNFNLSVISIRWFLGLFLHQFNIDDSLLLWDTVMSCPSDIQLNDHIMYLGLAVIHLNRQKIIQEEDPLKTLNKIKQTPLEIIQTARNLYQLFGKVV